MVDSGREVPIFMYTICSLGSHVSASVFQPYPAKIESIQVWPLPLYTRIDVLKSLGLASYHRTFIPRLAFIAAPLTGVLNKQKQIVLTEAERTAANMPPDCPTLFPVLILPDSNNLFFLTTGANNAAVGVIPSEQADNSKRHQAIARHSHRFTQREQRGSVHEKELYTV